MRIRTDSSPLKKSLTTPIKALLVGAMLLTPLATAYAGEDAQSHHDSEKLKRQILASLDHPELVLKSTNDSSQEASGNGFRLSKKGPIQYRRTLQIGDDEVSFRLYGPMVKKHPGLRFRVDGLRFGGHSVQLEGFGNTKAGALRFTIRF